MAEVVGSLKDLIEKLFKHILEFDITVELRSGERSLGTLRFRGSTKVKPAE